MERIIGKLLSQLEREAATIKPSQIPLAVAILTDKSALLSGRPTSMSATLTLKGEFNAEEIRARLTGKAAKTIKATAVDAKPGQLGVGTQSVYPTDKGRQKLPSALESPAPPDPPAISPVADMQSSDVDPQTIDLQHT